MEYLIRKAKPLSDEAIADAVQADDGWEMHGRLYGGNDIIAERKERDKELAEQKKRADELEKKLPKSLAFVSSERLDQTHNEYVKSCEVISDYCLDMEHEPELAENVEQICLDYGETKDKLEKAEAENKSLIAHMNKREKETYKEICGLGAKLKAAELLLKRVMHYLTNSGTLRVEPFSTEWEKVRDAE